jgi:DNA polymerase
LSEAAEDIQGCTRCDIHLIAKRAVFGEGPPEARVMLVGEQPGDQEDLSDKPFVGPAGRLLDEALEAAGLDRRAVYVTNAVKRFKFEPRGKRRIHKKPNAGEVMACRFWLDLERALVRPQVIVALGATAAASLLGRSASVGSLRGRGLPLDGGGWLFVTVHPSYLLRMPDRSRAQAERRAFVADLRAANEFDPKQAEAAGLAH